MEHQEGWLRKVSRIIRLRNDRAGVREFASERVAAFVAEVVPAQIDFLDLLAYDGAGTHNIHFGMFPHPLAEAAVLGVREGLEEVFAKDPSRWAGFRVDDPMIEPTGTCQCPKCEGVKYPCNVTVIWGPWLAMRVMDKTG